MGLFRAAPEILQQAVKAAEKAQSGVMASPAGTPAFRADNYDGKIRTVIPFYDDIYDQIFGVIKTYFGDRELSVLDTGCGTGNYAVRAASELRCSEMILCDPSEKMLEDAKKKLEGVNCEFSCVGSEQLDYEERFDLVTAIQSHHYFTREQRETAVKNCFRALKPGGLFICFENTAPFTQTGKDIVLRRVEEFSLKAGRSEQEVKHHSSRYGTEYFPLNISEHLELLRNTGFSITEMLWYSYLQSGFYAVK